MRTSPLIPRRALFDNPTFAGARFSPDTTWLSWLAPVDGVLNIWLAPSGDFGSGQPVTRTKGRPINWHDWSPDGRFLMFLNDENGDENTHFFAVDPTTLVLRDLTPIDKVNAGIGYYSRVVPDTVTIQLNDRDARWHDVYALDIATGKRRLIWENTQEFSWVGLDWQLRPRHARSTNEDGSAQLWRIDKGVAEPWLKLPYDDSLTTRLMAFNRAGTHVHMSSSIDRDTAALVRMDWATGAQSVVTHDPRADFSDVLWDMQTFEVAAASCDPGQEEWTHVTSAVAADFALIRQKLPGHSFSITSQTEDDRRWIVSAYRADRPSTSFVLDRDAQSLIELFSTRPDLKPYRLAPMQTIKAKSRDGLPLVSYLTLPVDTVGDRPAQPLPMVLVVHGGPWSRDSDGYRGDHQWLADRGYAVLSVNYRGSTGFGKAFVNASVHEHGRKMHDDLIDMVEWAIAEGIADAAKIAIHGGSYGGYASFLGATFTPDVFCCSVPVVGITNLQTLLESIPPYWAGFTEYMYKSYGDPRTEDGRKLLAERSPIHKVDQITKPMLIFHGANDVRCKVAESDTIVAAMQAKGIPVTYVVYPDEGHGFRKPANRLAYIAIAEAFLAKHLGGACEPVGTDFDGSSHEVRAGVDVLGKAGVPV
jgi:dipeptidyl aminopeptidase/acylaminoacyl peptidase